MAPSTLYVVIVQLIEDSFLCFFCFSKVTPWDRLNLLYQSNAKVCKAMSLDARETPVVPQKISAVVDVALELRCRRFPGCCSWHAAMIVGVALLVLFLK